MESAEEKTRRRIGAIWEKGLPELRARLEALGRAAEAAAAGTLGDEEARAARELAHKLAGSLGMFGYMEGTRIARELEVLLDGGAVAGPRIGEMVMELRGSLPLG